MILRLHDEGPEAAQRSPDGDGGEDENGRGRFALRETKSSPDDKRPANERYRVITGRNRKPAAENGFAQQEQQAKENGDFEIFLQIEPPPRADTPQDQQGCDNEIAGG